MLTNVDRHLGAHLTIYSNAIIVVPLLRTPFHAQEPEFPMNGLVGRVGQSTGLHMQCQGRNWLKAVDQCAPRSGLIVSPALEVCSVSRFYAEKCYSLLLCSARV